MTIILSYRQAYLHKMKEDPIVAEIHAIRDKLAAKSGYDVKELFRRLRKQEAKSGLDYVGYPPCWVPTTSYDIMPGSTGKRGGPEPPITSQVRSSDIRAKS